MDITQGFLLAFAIIMEIPMMMILLSRLLRGNLNRWLNVVAGIILTAVQAWSLFTGSNTLHYMFFSVVEIGLTAAISILSLRWSQARVDAA